MLFKKDNTYLEKLVEEQEQTIHTLETKLRLQTTIANDLSALNTDLHKTNAKLENQINDQMSIIHAAENGYKKQQAILKQLKEEYGQQKKKEEELLLKLNHYKEESLRFKNRSSELEHALVEQERQNKVLAQSVDDLKNQQLTWNIEKQKYKNMIAELHIKLQHAYVKLKKVKPQNENPDLLSKMKTFLSK